MVSLDRITAHSDPETPVVRSPRATREMTREVAQKEGDGPRAVSTVGATADGLGKTVELKGTGVRANYTTKELRLSEGEPTTNGPSQAVPVHSEVVVSHRPPTGPRDRTTYAVPIRYVRRPRRKPEWTPVDRLNRRK